MGQELTVLIVLLGACVVSGLIIWYALGQMNFNDKKQKCTQEVIGTIIEVKEMRQTVTDKDNRVTDRYMVYSPVFEINYKGQKYITTEGHYMSGQVFLYNYDCLPEEGDSYELLMDPEDPTNIAFDWKSYAGVGGFGFALVAVGIFGAFFVAFSLLSAMNIF